MKNLIIFGLLILPGLMAGCSGVKDVFGYSAGKLQYSQAFDEAAGIGDFAFSDDSIWTLTDDQNGGFVLDAAGQSGYVPPVRSPNVIAVLSDRVFGDFVLEADVMQTGKEYAHRDMCVFFGMKDAGRYYYAHIASRADEHANSIFIVNRKDRESVASFRSHGVQWGENTWHKLRLVRKMSGLIEVYFDDMKQPIMTADDSTFPAGYIGFGSFDDEVRVDNIKIFADDMLIKKSMIF